MYHLYTTDAFVLSGSPFGEGSKHLTLLTREFGLLFARVQSVREARSKLRYGLQDLSYSSVTLVRGKEIWRVVSASCTEDLFEAFRDRPDHLALFARVFGLLRRLLPGEEKNERLFQSLLETALFLRAGKVPRKELPSVEVVLVLRILHALGYVSPRSEFSDFFADAVPWGEKVLEKASTLRALALADINESLKASQL